MTVDLSKLRAGDKVKFLCGFQLTVAKISPITLEAGAVYLNWIEDYDRGCYHSDGLGWANGPRDPLNIVEILPAPEHDIEVKP